ncbi:UBA/TS-N domain containing protein [Entamoeba histolytica HM-1:IMSS-B]|uniref:Ubiquitin-like protein n=6 Tax=Entamoeba histolytica TaxID=5759 RepID=C4M914_ENTH1|nr:ubiquitin-like protein [Entamoeba histolytica HM-1:IMSS]EMD49218.1 ubiquitin family protein [Entamoeba histolytica KU27]EMH72767.1 UBA/TS-N domain containing protein [Entamoeba histolytica HM-1:IMSS-B]EMS11992.1 ubiquitin family protein [Entamoeba histolytica HM-3:IMSS]ENY65018.1 ubiquitin family protein, putative [Entamoeba histolytica HM-1:IMSS-A]BAN37543.1 UBA/TS-N domain-containing protein [Entamoeba histolytica]|eukprot:XP_649202.1 ubiquitin-like protein [Entamoeba histolytica HM-1:IMSS]
MKVLFCNVSNSIQESIDIEETHTITIGQIHQLIASKLKSLYSDITLIYRGYKLTDSSLFSTIGYQEGSKIIFIQKKKKQEKQEEKEERIEKQEQPLHSVLNDTSCDSPSDDFLNDPTLIRLFLQNGLFKEFFEKHPEMEDIINDPKELKNMMKMMRNPQLMNQALMNADNAINQVENLPGGHNELVRLVNGFEPLEDALKPNVKFNPEVSNDQFKMEKPLDQPFNLFEERTSDKLMNDNGLFSFGNNPVSGYNSFGLPAQNYQTPSLYVPIPSPSSTLPPRQRYSSQLQSLKEMGFLNDEENLSALIQANGELSTALDILERGH